MEHGTRGGSGTWNKERKYYVTWNRGTKVCLEEGKEVVHGTSEGVDTWSKGKKWYLEQRKEVVHGTREGSGTWNKGRK